MIINVFNTIKKSLFVEEVFRPALLRHLSSFVLKDFNRLIDKRFSSVVFCFHLSRGFRLMLSLFTQSNAVFLSKGRICAVILGSTLLFIIFSIAHFSAIHCQYPLENV